MLVRKSETLCQYISEKRQPDDGGIDKKKSNTINTAWLYRIRLCRIYYEQKQYRTRSYVIHVLPIRVLCHD